MRCLVRSTCGLLLGFVIVSALSHSACGQVYGPLPYGGVEPAPFAAGPVLLSEGPLAQLGPIWPGAIQTLASGVSASSHNSGANAAASSTIQSTTTWNNASIASGTPSWLNSIAPYGPPCYGTHLGGSGGLIEAGAGMRGANSFSGATTINEGALQLSQNYWDTGGGDTGTGGTIITSGVLNVSGGNIMTGSEAGGTTINAGSSPGEGSECLQGSDDSGGACQSGLAVSAPFDAGDMTITGGMLAFTGGTNTYTGGTTVNSGTLILTNNAASGGALTVGSPLPVPYIPLNANQTLVGGWNSYTGGTTVQGGTLIVTNSEPIEAGSNLYVGDPSLSPFGSVVPADGTLSIASGAVSIASPLELADGSSLAVGNDAGLFSARPSIGPMAIPAVSAVPEPGTLALLALAAGTILALRFRASA